MSDDLTQRVQQLESDLGIVKYNLAQIIEWIESHIYATETAETKKSRADRNFLKAKYNDN